MGLALDRLAQEDPSFRVASDHESGQTVIKGMGELHLEIIVDRMKREFKVEANVGAPQVAYRETITRKVEQRLHPQEADRRLGPVRARQDPLRAGARRARASSSRTRSSAARCRREFVPGVEKGLKAAKETGVIAGFPMIDFKATLIDGAYHDVDSSVLAFEIAARAAFARACPRPDRSCSSRS